MFSTAPGTVVSVTPDVGTAVGSTSAGIVVAVGTLAGVAE